MTFTPVISASSNCSTCSSLINLYWLLTLTLVSVCLYLSPCSSIRILPLRCHFDVWALGVLLLTMLNGRLPFSASGFNLSSDCQPPDHVVRGLIVRWEKEQKQPCLLLHATLTCRSYIEAWILPETKPNLPISLYPLLTPPNSLNQPCRYRRQQQR